MIGFQGSQTPIDRRGGMPPTPLTDPGSWLAAFAAEHSWIGCRPMQRSLLLSIALTLTVASPALAEVKSFYSPSKNISCEVSSGGEGGAYAFCQSLQKPRSVTLSEQGTLKVCDGTQCLGDGPEDAFELGYGNSVKVGDFTCTSKQTGMRCSVSPSGNGFELSRAALDQF
jgi:hypothetical protein